MIVLVSEKLPSDLTRPVKSESSTIVNPGVVLEGLGEVTVNSLLSCETTTLNDNSGEVPLEPSVQVKLSSLVLMPYVPATFGKTFVPASLPPPAAGGEKQNKEKEQHKRLQAHFKRTGLGRICFHLRNLTVDKGWRADIKNALAVFSRGRAEA